ncbi:MAG: undecaprenyldiphospho-muramoylpentapeptide beta-N-acetylglucosaminyltransferase [Ignavibacteriae bacterium]|nr:undecaprenyldiphospho-muramoylpentapeptide beta-N-acetylglucosaminyltransferase [Ignavibacteriota bacterium]
MASIRIIFAGGGTGGHLFPALAIADEIKKLEPNAEILFVGTRDKLEARVVPNKGYPFRSIWISGFHRGLRPSNLLFPVKLIVAMIQGLWIIKDFKPNVVVGTGGYVSGPVLYSATMLKIPTLIQEQNQYPGKTTRFLAKRVNELHLAFEQSKQYFSRMENIFVTGNPTRNDLENVHITEALKYFGFQPSDTRKTLLVFGGSLGAHTINKAVKNNLGQLIALNIRLIWQTGSQDFEDAKGVCEGYSSENVWCSAFIDRMDYAYAVSDLIICRSGATTIAELTRLGKPAILVPYPHAAANHQVENAKTLSESGAAAVIYDHEISEKMYSTVSLLLNDKTLTQMSEQSKMLGKPHAAQHIAQRVLQLARSKTL